MTGVRALVESERKVKVQWARDDTFVVERSENRQHGRLRGWER